MKKILKIGVRALVERLYRSGDLIFDYFSQSRAIDGIRAHQHVQGSRPAAYLPEVSVMHRYETPDYILELSGRIDGILREEKQVVVEEIKTTTRPKAQLIVDNNPVHWAQLKAYAYIYAVAHNAAEIVGQLTYVHPEKHQTIELRQTFEMPALEAFFTDMIRRYLKWADFQAEWEEMRTRSIHALEFPFEEFRPYQRRMAVAVFRTIRARQKILIQAPTGIGKTMGAVFPAVKTMDRENMGKLFFLTARTTGRTAAEKVFRLLEKKGLCFKTVTLTAKDKICFRPQDGCDSQTCAFAKGYYDRLNDALWAALAHDRLAQAEIESIAAQFEVCPFEFSLEVSEWMDGIICDYNYAFDPRVYLRRHFVEGAAEHILLIDEAHNLVDRSREMFSAEIAKQPLLALRRMLKGHLKAVYKNLSRINRWFLAAAKQASEKKDHWADKKIPSALLPLLDQFTQSAAKWLRLNINTPYREKLLEHYFAVMTFLRVTELFDDSYAVCYTKEEDDLIVKLFCIDPSRQLAQALKRGGAAIFFSATLTPPHYFQYLFGCSQNTRNLTLPSPFPRENLALFRADHVSTFYKDRANTSRILCDLLSIFMRTRQGNYLFFFPSYAYLTMIHSLFTAANPETDVIVQRPDMPERERTEFLERFQSENSHSLVGFAVLGGIFGEGIDLVGDRLCGAAVVGVGLPGISIERELIRAYHEEKDNCGFEFAYRSPGINRVLQAAGRVIRTENDRGAVLLIDSRFIRQEYATLLPEHWLPVRVITPERLRNALEIFWQKNQPSQQYSRQRQSVR